LTELAVTSGALIPLNQNKRPGCYLHRSNPNDVARAEDLTFICTPCRDEAGPTNNWMPPKEAYRKLRGWLEGSMRGRTMYVVPGETLCEDSCFEILAIRCKSSATTEVEGRLPNGSSSDLPT